LRGDSADDIALNEDFAEAGEGTIRLGTEKRGLAGAVATGRSGMEKREAVNSSIESGNEPAETLPMSKTSLKEKEEDKSRSRSLTVKEGVHAKSPGASRPRQNPSPGKVHASGAGLSLLS